MSAPSAVSVRRLPELDADSLCARIADAVVAHARGRDLRVRVSCRVLLAHRTVVVAGELGYWPPMGHYEGVLAAVPALVRAELERAPRPLLAVAPQRFEVLLRLQRLSATQARTAIAVAQAEWNC